MKYEIYQIKDIGHTNYAFHDYELAKKLNDFDFNDYKKVYEGEIECDDVYDTLEDLFTIFNIKRPQDFKGHSMSVSDIVKLGDDYYYVNGIGFKKIDIGE